MKDKNPIGTRACMKIASYVKSTYFFPRKSQESTYIFLRILPLSFLLKKRLIIIVKVHYDGLVSRIWTAEMVEYVGQICSRRSQKNSFASQAINAI